MSAPDPTLTSLHIYPDDTLSDGQRVHYGGSDRFDVSRAEYERMRAMFVEPERSCFTCAHDEDNEEDDGEDDGTLFELGHLCKIKVGRDDIFDYCVKSGAFDTHDGMPTNRSIPCPGWQSK